MVPELRRLGITHTDDTAVFEAGCLYAAGDLQDDLIRASRAARSDQDRTVPVV